MSEHLRVSLIDPRYQQQRNAMLAKIRETTKASDDEIARNLVGLAKSRPDVFGACIHPNLRSSACAERDCAIVSECGCGSAIVLCLRLGLSPITRSQILFTCLAHRV